MRHLVRIVQEQDAQSKGAGHTGQGAGQGRGGHTGRAWAGPANPVALMFGVLSGCARATGKHQRILWPVPSQDTVTGTLFCRRQAMEVGRGPE